MLKTTDFHSKSDLDLPNSTQQAPFKSGARKVKSFAII